MQADYSVALGREDAVLELPWHSQESAIRYCNLKRHPELVAQIPEAAGLPELSAFLTRMNASAFPLETAKCDAWFTRELSAEEEIFGAAGKLASYVDLVFSEERLRLSFEEHEVLGKRLCDLLKRAPEMAAAVELVIRRCFFHIEDDPHESMSGFAITAYVSGFGDDEAEARRRWSIALALLQHALVQAAQ